MALASSIILLLGVFLWLDLSLEIVFFLDFGEAALELRLILLIEFFNWMFRLSPI